MRWVLQDPRVDPDRRSVKETEVGEITDLWKRWGLTPRAVSAREAVRQRLGCST